MKKLRGATGHRGAPESLPTGFQGLPQTPPLPISASPLGLRCAWSLACWGRTATRTSGGTRGRCDFRICGRCTTRRRTRRNRRCPCRRRPSAVGRIMRATESVLELHPSDHERTGPGSRPGCSGRIFGELQPGLGEVEKPRLVQRGPSFGRAMTFVPPSNRRRELFLKERLMSVNDDPSGRARARHVRVSVFAEFERSIIRERVLPGMARAKAKGTKSGKAIGRPAIAPPT